MSSSNNLLVEGLFDVREVPRRPRTRGSTTKHTKWMPFLLNASTLYTWLYNMVVNHRSGGICCSIYLGKKCVDISHAFVDHETKDSHHGGTPVLDLNSSLVLLPFIGLLIPSEIQKAISEVAREFGTSSVISVGHFHNHSGHEKLSDNLIGQVVQCSESGWDILKTGKTDTGWWKLFCCDCFSVAGRIKFEKSDSRETSCQNNVFVYIPYVTKYPTTANIEMRPCFNSTERRCSNRSWSALSRRFQGSKSPNGATTPGSPEKSAAKAEDDRDCWAGAKAAALATMEARTAIFILISIFLFL